MLPTLLRCAVLSAFLASAGMVGAQAPAPSGVLLSVNLRAVRAKFGAKNVARKRFYLFAGDRSQNAALVERIKNAEIVSRNCYYTGAKASNEYICWLQQDNCESPFCRDISAGDIAAVPEFGVAYKKGQTLFRAAKRDIANDWILTNLPPNLVSGFFLQQKKAVAQLLGGTKPLQTIMTDNLGGEAVFTDVPAGTTYFITNLLPIEFGKQTVVWTCDFKTTAGKKNSLTMKAASDTACEITLRDLKVCNTAECPKPKPAG